MEDYIPLENCCNRFVYRIHSRNLAVGVYSVERRGFIGIREKFDWRYLFTEYHWDTGPPFGTVRPIRYLCILPAQIDLTESWIKKTPTGDRYRMNWQLFRFLDKLERRIF